MKNSFLAAGVALALALGMAPSGCSEGADPRPTADEQRVHKLFESMRDGKYTSIEFPKLTLADVPTLFEYADSLKDLKTFPRALESSQYEAECREGIVALWLIEGVRVGGKFPSLNALCFKKGVENGNYKTASEANHKEMLKAYRAWWDKAKSLSADEAKKIEPLKETELRWY